MKKKIILSITTLLVLGLGIVGFAYSPTDVTSAAVSCCCCSGDSCPMMKKDAAGKTVTAGHENCDCCKGGRESCPMMKKDASGKMEHGANCPMMMKKGENASADAKDGASCPMMKKGDGSADMKMMHDEHHMKMADGSTCCCPCCQHENKEKTETAAPAA
jgi:hypothetical protein